jgi:hypothetical protein
MPQRRAILVGTPAVALFVIGDFTIQVMSQKLRGAFSIFIDNAHSTKAVKSKRQPKTGCLFLTIQVLARTVGTRRVLNATPVSSGKLNAAATALDVFPISKPLM